MASSSEKIQGTIQAARAVELAEKKEYGDGTESASPSWRHLNHHLRAQRVAYAAQSHPDGGPEILQSSQHPALQRGQRRPFYLRVPLAAWPYLAAALLLPGHHWSDVGLVSTLSMAAG